MVDGQRTRLASLTPEQERKVRDVEQQLGDVYVIAYEQPLVPAHLEPEEMQALREAERGLPGVVLVAYEKKQPQVA